MAKARDRNPDDLIVLHVSTLGTTSIPTPSTVSPRLVPYIEGEGGDHIHNQNQHEISDSDQSHPQTSSSSARTSDENETLLLRDLTQDEYDEMSKIETEMRQAGVNPEANNGTDNKAVTDDQITIDDFGMVRVHGQELIKIGDAIPNPDGGNADNNSMNCGEEGKIIGLLIQSIEKEVGAVEGDDEHLEDEEDTDEEMDTTDDENQGQGPMQSGASANYGSGEGEHVVIYLNSEVKSKRQIRVNKCDRCNLLFGSRALLYTHYSTMHMDTRNTKASTTTSKRRPGSQVQFTSCGAGDPNPDSDLVLDPSAMLIELGPKQFRCRKCERVFKRSFDVIRHYDCVHNGATTGGLRAYACRRCDKSFSRKDNLQRHEKTHDMNRTLFSCETCHKLFTRKFDTIRHYELVHKKTDTDTTLS